MASRSRRQPDRQPLLSTRKQFKIMKSQTPKWWADHQQRPILAHAPRPNSAPYTATKHGITGLTKSTSLDGRKYNISCGQIDIGNAATEMTAKMRSGVPQANELPGSRTRTVDVENVARAVVYMAILPLDANVQFITTYADPDAVHRTGVKHRCSMYTWPVLTAIPWETWSTERGS